MDQILSDILEGVSKIGSHECPAVTLINLPFRADYSPGKTSEQKMKEWSDSNGLRFEVYDRRMPNGKEMQWVRFVKRR